MKFSDAMYSELEKGLSNFGKNLSTLIEELLLANDIQIHSVSCRVKEPKSARRKFIAGNGKYAQIQDMTDLLGLRVITYFPDDVDRVAVILKNEFDIDQHNSIDKRKLLDPDKFGYLSLHFVATLKETRSTLAEYKRFATTKFEIQIRSILQHAWAEIEHDLGYKAEGSLPSDVRRNFSRLAGLLELADDEFERIRKKIKNYEKHVAHTIDKSPQRLAIDQSTVSVALDKEKILRELDEAVAAVGNRSLEEGVSVRFVAGEVRDLKLLGVRNINELTEVATRLKDHVEEFAKIWLSPKKTKSGSFNRGIGLFYLNYVLIAQVKESAVRSYWNPPLQADHPHILEEVDRTWDKVIDRLGEPK